MVSVDGEQDGGSDDDEGEPEKAWAALGAGAWSSALTILQGILKN